MFTSSLISQAANNAAGMMIPRELPTFLMLVRMIALGVKVKTML